MSATLRVLRIGQQAADRFAVVLAFCSGVVRVFGEHNGKHTAVLTRYIVCLFVVSNVALEAEATPARDGRAEFVDGRQVLGMKPESDLRKGTVRVFSEVEKSVVEGTAVSGGSVAMPLDVWSGYGIQEPQEQYASGTKEPNVKGCEGDTKGVHWGWLLVLAIWIVVA